MLWHDAVLLHPIMHNATCASPPAVHGLRHLGPCQAAVTKRTPPSARVSDGRDTCVCCQGLGPSRQPAACLHAHVAARLPLTWSTECMHLESICAD
jgi:hypothetical protein